MRRGSNVFFGIVVALFGCFTGTVRAQEAPRVVLNADFATTSLEAVIAPEKLAGVSLTSDLMEIAGGSRSLKGDSRASTAEWNEFFHLKQGILAP